MSNPVKRGSAGHVEEVFDLRNLFAAVVVLCGMFWRLFITNQHRNVKPRCVLSIVAVGNEHLTNRPSFYPVFFPVSPQVSKHVGKSSLISGVVRIYTYSCGGRRQDPQASIFAANQKTTSLEVYIAIFACDLHDQVLGFGIGFRPEVWSVKFR